MMRIFACLSLLLLAVAPAVADDWMKDTAPALKRLLNTMENDADRLAHEYKISLRRANRWLPRGDEAVAWQQLQELQKALNRLENGFGGERPLELEWKMDGFLRQWETSRQAMRRVQVSRRVKRLWEELSAGVTELRLESTILKERNARYVQPAENRWKPANDPARLFSRDELERLRSALLEAEDLSNRFKTDLRDRSAKERGHVPVGAAALVDADLRESAFALERHLDALVQSWLTRGAGTLEPELEVMLSWGRRVDERLHREAAPVQALKAWSLLAPQLDELAELYGLSPVR
jgi:hypothetical protein